jgi:hypothetical protein
MQPYFTDEKLSPHTDGLAKECVPANLKFRILYSQSSLGGLATHTLDEGARGGREKKKFAFPKALPRYLQFTYFRINLIIKLKCHLRVLPHSYVSMNDFIHVMMITLFM